MASLRRYCLALDLKNQAECIERYKAFHAPGQAWPEITDSIKGAGIAAMDIYCVGNRLLMIMDVEAHFDFAVKAKADAENPKVQEWERLMEQFQSPLPWAKADEKWLLMDNIFTLK